MDRLDATGARSALHMERSLKHHPDRVWRAISEPARMADWFPGIETVDLRLGGTMNFGDGEEGIITDLDAPRLIAYTWGGDHLRWEIVPDGEGSKLVLVHTFADKAGAASFASGWHTCFTELDRSIAGLPPTEHGIDINALHEEYLNLFGLDTATTAEPDGAGWRVRYERQLVRKADEVWAALDSASPWPAAGPVDVREEPAVLEHDVPDGRVRWELKDGTGHGTRLVVSWTGADEAARDTALATAPRHVEALLARLG
ncbi:SRPBCC family protein [Pseudonocardia sp. TRM90224]|uniref:SRPBCC family protein n=1 Tax=Pseudonocardia sp. TRM90224 TaxID=2812678 RepID=UPI001E5CCECB|nr:SRPBCC family protein [Pseudonocardia sp. TRM90224]